MSTKTVKAKKEKVIKQAVPVVATVPPEERAKAIDKEIAVLNKKSESFLAIESSAQYAQANEFLALVKGRADEIEKERKSITVPLNAALDAANAVYQPRLKKCKEVTDIVKNAMSAFLRAENEKAQKEEKRLADLRAKQDERREEKGQAPVATPLPTVARPETVVQTDAGKTVAKKVWKFEITTLKDIPQQYLQQTLKLAIEAGMLNKVLKQAVDGGVRDIAGVRIYEDFAISTSINKGSIPF